MVMQAMPIPILSLAHAATTGQTAADHHAATVAADLNLADLAERLHASLASIGATDHHTSSNQADMESEAADQDFVRADRVRFSPGVVKLHVSIVAAGTVEGILYNVASVTDTGTGDRSVVVDDDFSSVANSRWGGGIFEANGNALCPYFITRAVGSCNLQTFSQATITDLGCAVWAFGDQ